jgi:hypothetical protein
MTVGRTDHYYREGEQIGCDGEPCRPHGLQRAYMRECPRCGHISRRELDRRALLEDVQWLLDTGETHIECMANRLNVVPSALVRRLERLGRGDLVSRITGRTEKMMGKRVAA